MLSIIGVGSVALTCNQLSFRDSQIQSAMVEPRAASICFTQSRMTPSPQAEHLHRIRRNFLSHVQSYLSIARISAVRLPSSAVVSGSRLDVKRRQAAWKHQVDHDLSPFSIVAGTIWAGCDIWL